MPDTLTSCSESQMSPEHRTHQPRGFVGESGVLRKTMRGLLLVACLVSTSHGENWPGWRGPSGDGHSPETNIPTSWDGSTGKNVAWKVKVPGEGHSSPIVWGDRVFLTSCQPDTLQRLLICLDRDSGDMLWKRVVLEARLESKHALNSYASGTPATDGEQIYVSFLEVGTRQIPAPNVGSERLIYPGRIVVAAYDFDGEQNWVVRPGDFISAHGFASNPVLYKDLVIVNGDHDGESYLVALHRYSGDEVWRTPRRHKTRSYTTPLIRKIDGQDQLVLSGSKCIASFNPNTGKLNWHVEGPTEQFVASMVFDGNRFFAVGGYPTHHVMAIQPDGKGDVTGSHVVWHKKNVRCYVPSPVVIGKHLMVADDRGTANAFDTETGERHWQARLGKHFSGSLVAGAGLAYFTADDGITKIVRPAEQPQFVAENRLGEYVYSSPAISNGQFFIRAETHLYCIGKEAATR